MSILRYQRLKDLLAHPPAATKQNKMKASKKTPVSLFPIYLVSFIGALGFSIVLPFLVTLVTRFGGNALIYGAIGATYSAFQLVGAPILGRWSDVHGRRKILLLSQLGTLASWVVFLFALFLPTRALLDVDSAHLGSFVLTVPLLILFAARAMDGLTGGNVSVANAYLADVTEEEERNETFGKMAVASNLGFILGPAMAGLLGATAYGEVVPVVVALVISLVASGVIAFLLPESRPCVLVKNPEKTSVRKVFGQEHTDCFKLQKVEQVGWRDVFKVRRVPFLLLLYFIIFLGFNLFYAAFPVQALRGLEWSITDIGFFFSYLGLTTVIVQGPLLSRAAKIYSDSSLVLLGSFILGVGFLFLTAETRIGVYIGGLLFSLGNGLMWPSFLAILSRAGERKVQGSIQGLAASVGSLASIVGLILGGALFDVMGNATFFLSGVLFFFVFLLSFEFIPLGTKQNLPPTALSLEWLPGTK